MKDWQIAVFGIRSIGVVPSLFFFFFSEKEAVRSSAKWKSRKVKLKGEVDCMAVSSASEGSLDTYK